MELENSLKKVLEKKFFDKTNLFEQNSDKSLFQPV